MKHVRVRKSIIILNLTLHQYETIVDTKGRKLINIDLLDN